MNLSAARFPSFFFSLAIAALACTSFLAVQPADASALSLPSAPHAPHAPIELHNKLALRVVDDKSVALTLDACGGAHGESFDAELIDYLIAQRIPATIFVTKKWLDANARGLAQLRVHADLFELEDHGAAHVPAVLGAGRRVYGIAGVGDMNGLAREVQGGAAAITQATGHAPHWYRGATAEYDAEALRAIEAMGYRVAGFSLNADAGATLPLHAVAARVSKAQAGDIIIAHMNKPRSQTAEGLMIGLAELQKRGFSFVKLGEMQVTRL